MVSLQLVFFCGAADAKLWGVEQMVGLERNAARSSAWPALHISLILSGLLVANPAWRIAAHHAAFSAGAFARCN